MITLTPKQAIDLSKTHFEEVFKSGFEYRKLIISQFKDHTLDDLIINELQSFFKLSALILFTPDQIKEMLEVFPYERASIINHTFKQEEEKCFDMDIRDLLLNMVGQYFMHSDWPKFNNPVDLLTWGAALTDVAYKLGFTIEETEILLPA